MLTLIHVTRLGGRVANAAPRRKLDVGTPIGILGALALLLFAFVLEGAALGPLPAGEEFKELSSILRRGNEAPTT
ncbi:MAG: hypothetical protein M3442_17860 [Chloroflexota bacterium]|nr:hypothetical protein [Chloroflexota bacterium]